MFIGWIVYCPRTKKVGAPEAVTELGTLTGEAEALNSERREALELTNATPSMNKIKVPNETLGCMAWLSAFRKILRSKRSPISKAKATGASRQRRGVVARPSTAEQETRSLDLHKGDQTIIPQLTDQINGGTILIVKYVGINLIYFIFHN